MDVSIDRALLARLRSVAKIERKPLDQVIQEALEHHVRDRTAINIRRMLR
jgi:ribosomal protein L18E